MEEKELGQKRIASLIGILIAAFSAHPLAVNLALLGDPNVNTVVGGISGAGFILGFILGCSVFMKTPQNSAKVKKR